MINVRNSCTNVPTKIWDYEIHEFAIDFNQDEYLRSETQEVARPMVGSARKLKLSYRWAQAFHGARNSFQNVTVKAFSKIWQHLKCKSETQSKCIQNVDTFKMYHKNYIQYVTQKLYSKCNKKLYSKCNSEEKEEMVTGGLGGCSGVYRLSFLLSFVPLIFLV